MTLRAHTAIALAATVFAGGCGGLAVSTRPEPRPAGAGAVETDMSEAVAQPSEAETVRASYQAAESDLQRRGLLRTDPGDDALAGLTSDTLAATFIRVAMYDEFDPNSTRPSGDSGATALRRWETPVRIGVEFGASVPEEERLSDLDTIKALATRLSTASGHPISLSDRTANLVVFVVNEDEERNLAPRLRSTVPGITPAMVLGVTGLPISQSCLSAGFAGADQPYVFRRAVVVVRAEQPALSRTSCYHEEIAQSLGLVNDTPEARPSIFNDDEEFALLTTFDEMMLAMLYDPRLSPGMTLDEVMPRAREIAAEILPQTADNQPDPKES